MELSKVNDSERENNDLSLSSVEFIDLVINNVIDKVKSFRDTCISTKIQPVVLNERSEGYNNSCTPLIMAAQYNRAEIVELLIECGASIDTKNKLGNTALMVAAEQGSFEVLKILVEKANADVSLFNKYGQTACMLAVESNNIRELKWMVNYIEEHQYKNHMGIDIPNPLTAVNTYNKDAMLIASEFGKYEIVEWLIKDKNMDASTARKSDNVSALMYACAGGSNDHEKVAEILIEHGANINSKAKFGDSALKWAVDGGNVNIVKKLTSQKIHIQKKAFFEAVKRGRYEIAKELIRALEEYGGEIENGEEVWDKWVIEKTDEYESNALKLAIMHGWIGLATELFMVEADENDDEMILLNAASNSVLSNPEIALAANAYGEQGKKESLFKLIDYAVRYDFHFDLFMRLIPYFPSPLNTLHQALPHYFSLLKTEARGGDKNVLHRIVRLYSSIAQAKITHPLEKNDLQIILESINELIYKIVSCETMNDPSKVKEILCHASKVNNKIPKDEIVQRANAFRYGPLDHCVNNYVLAIFGSGSISTFVDKLFNAFFRSRTDEQEDFPRPFQKFFEFNLNAKIMSLKKNKKPYNTYNIEKYIFPPIKYSVESENLRDLRSNFIYVRYCPAFMFILEGLSKLFFFILVVVFLFNMKFPGETISENGLEIMTQTEFFEHPLTVILIIYTIACLMFEYGEACNSEYTSIPSLGSLFDYIYDFWNIMDTFGLLLVLSSILTSASLNDREASDARAALSTSCIFLCIGLLRCLLPIEEIGKLTIVVFAMTKELFSYLVLASIFSFGFAVNFYSLYHEEITDSYGSVSKTAIDVIMNALNSFENPYSIFITENHTRYSTIGIIIYLVYVVFFGVVLLNLVIAKMSSAYEEVLERSNQELQYTRAVLVEQYSLIEERSPFCMLPPPLNLFPCAVSIYDLYLLVENYILKKWKLKDEKPDEIFISYTSTSADILMGVIMSFFAPFIETFNYVVTLRRQEKIFNTLTEVIYFAVCFPVHYLLFLIVLLNESFSIKTNLKLQQSDQDSTVSKYIVYFEDENIYEKPNPDELEDNKSPFVSIKVIRCEKLTDATHVSNPIVKLRVGNMELSTDPPLAKGEKPVYPNKLLIFPLDRVDLKTEDPIFSCVVVDRDPSSIEKFLGDKSVKNDEFREWIANGRYEGKLELDNYMGDVIVVIKSNFMNCLENRKVQKRIINPKSSKFLTSLKSKPSNKNDKNKIHPELKINGGSKKSTSKHLPDYFKKSTEKDDNKHWKQDLKNYSIIIENKKNDSAPDMDRFRINDEDLDKIFYETDVNHDGRLSYDELEFFLKQIGYPILSFINGEDRLFTVSEINEFIDCVLPKDDEDEDVKLLDDFSSKIREVFTDIDINQDKKITKNELRKKLESMGFMQKSEKSWLSVVKNNKSSFSSSFENSKKSELDTLTEKINSLSTSFNSIVSEINVLSSSLKSIEKKL